MAETYYFAVFCPIDDGGYSIFFPDVPEAISEGNDLAESMSMASDALTESLKEYVKASRELPAPSDLDTVQEKARAILRELDIEPAGALVYPLIAVPNLDTTPIKLSISMPRNVLEEIDRKARRAGMTRSGFLTRAAQAYSVS